MSQSIVRRSKPLITALVCTLLITFGAAQVYAQHESTGGPMHADATYAASMHERTELWPNYHPVSEAMLARPSDDDWLTWRRSDASIGYSPLKSIDATNVGNLHVAWRWALPRNPDEITPLVHDGVFYLAAANRVQALNAMTGDLLWQYERKLPAALQNGSTSPLKNMAILGNRVFAPTADGHLIALEAATGKVVWDHAVLGPIEQAAQIRVDGGPMVAKNMVLQGVRGCFTYRGGCFIVGLDADTGREIWRFNTVARPGTPAGETWNGTPLNQRFGGAVWTTGSYDPDLGIVYYGVGQTYDTASLVQKQAGSKNDDRGLYLDCTLALDPATTASLRGTTSILNAIFGTLIGHSNRASSTWTSWANCASCS